MKEGWRVVDEGINEGHWPVKADPLYFDTTLQEKYII